MFGRRSAGITAKDLTELVIPIMELGAELKAVRAELKAVKDERDKLFAALLEERSARLRPSGGGDP